MKTPPGPKLEAGFALPIAIGVGIVMILIATTMVIRSNQSQVASISQQQNHNSLAAAETGIAKYLSLFNRYRAFASSNSSEWDNRLADIQARPNCSGGSADPNYGATEVAAFFSASAVGNWVEIEPSTPEKGRYQLLEYEVNPTLSRGTLTIEGADGRNPDNTKTALTRLEIEFPLVGVTVSPVAAGDSTAECSFAALDLPITNSLNTFVSTENTDVPNVSFSANINSTITGNTTFPRSGDPDVENYTYVIGSDPALDLSGGETLTIESGKTVYLVTEEDVNVDGGQITLQNDAKLFIVSSANVTLTQAANADRPVVFSAEDSQPDASEAFQVFLTGIDSDLTSLGNDAGELEINLDSTSASLAADSKFRTLSFVAYAPDGSVNLNNNVSATPEISFTGSVWAKDFTTSASSATLSEFPAFTSQGVNSPDLPVFWKSRLDTTRLSKRLGSINSWKKTDS